MNLRLWWYIRVKECSVKAMVKKHIIFQDVFIGLININKPLFLN